jgi:hypothetical protein
MSEENVEVVRAWLDEAAHALNSGDPEALAGTAARYLSADVVYEEDPVWPDAGSFRGRNALVARFLEYRDLLHLGRRGRAFGIRLDLHPEGRGGANRALPGLVRPG